MWLGGLVIVLLILVIWLASTSYLPYVFINYVAMDSHPGLQVMGMSRWQIAQMRAKAGFIMKLAYDQKTEMGVMVKNTPVLATAVAAVAGTTAVEAATPQNVPTVPAPTPAAAAAAIPTPVVEKFSTNLAHRFGAMHA